MNPTQFIQDALWIAQTNNKIYYSLQEEQNEMNLKKYYVLQEFGMWDIPSSATYVIYIRCAGLQLTENVCQSN